MTPTYTRMHLLQLVFFFLREFYLMAFISDDNSLLSNQNTNQFLV